MNYKIATAIAGISILMFGCGSTSLVISTPVENIDTVPLKVVELNETQKKNWGHLDLERDTIPGIAVDRAYSDIIKNKKGKKVVVAVIDSGIDIDHEDLDDVLWTNKKEIPNNGKDDDNNGYVDDIHGWNFLGDAYGEQLEYVRLLASGDRSNPRFEEAETLLQNEKSEALQTKTFIDKLLENIPTAQAAIKKHLGKSNYTKADVLAINPKDEDLQKAVSTQLFLYDRKLSLKKVEEYAIYFDERIKYHFNKDFKGRKTNDNIDDFSEKGYGNGNVKPMVKYESHGTHVAGIIAAERNNGKGIDGVANNVEIMAIRTVPNGDEYDKDVALSIRYAVDNGAKVINGSFGKSFSPHAEKVRAAIKYASDNDVVFIHAAGNDSNNIDIEPNFPDDNVNFVEVSNSYIRVGSLTSNYGSKMVSDFSNYGQKNVDIFAPGSEIYSTMPENEYDFQGGTSMAAPAVAGIAALIRSYYPNLTAAQVKQVILQSGLALNTKVIVGGDPSDIKPISQLSTSGRIANAYNALIYASRMQ